MKTLYLAWQAPTSRAWFPVGRLDADPPRHDFRFRYTGGALDAEKDAGFQPLYSFPRFNEDYHAFELFPLFQNRVLGQNRREYPDFLDWLGLDARDADPMDILAVSGGERATDNLEVFPRIEKRVDNSFRVRFFAHGLRHLSGHSQARPKARSSMSSARQASSNPTSASFLTNFSLRCADSNTRTSPPNCSPNCWATRSKSAQSETSSKAASSRRC